MSSEMGFFLKLIELAEMMKLTALIKDNGLDNFISAWKPFVDFLCDKYNWGYLLSVILCSEQKLG